MRVVTKGVARLVFVFKKVVIKVPKFTYRWLHFLQGLVANINESETWKFNSGKFEKGHSHLLCPVIWCSWGGWILIMKRADAAKIYYDNGELLDFSKHIVEFPGDDTISNYGIIEGKIVKIDYGGLEIKTTPSWYNNSIECLQSCYICPNSASLLKTKHSYG